MLGIEKKIQKLRTENLSLEIRVGIPGGGGGAGRTQMLALFPLGSRGDSAELLTFSSLVT